MPLYLSAMFLYLIAIPLYLIGVSVFDWYLQLLQGHCICSICIKMQCAACI